MRRSDCLLGPVVYGLGREAYTFVKMVRLHPGLQRKGIKGLKMNKKLIQRIEEIFEQKLQAKTGWGRNEILALHKEAVTEALLELID